MDLNVLRQSLEDLGTVTYCDWNTDAELELLIVLDDFNGNEEAYQSIVADQVLPTCPFVEDYSYDASLSRVKGQYDKNVPQEGVL